MERRDVTFCKPIYSRLQCVHSFRIMASHGVEQYVVTISHELAKNWQCTNILSNGRVAMFHYRAVKVDIRNQGWPLQELFWVFRVKVIWHFKLFHASSVSVSV